MRERLYSILSKRVLSNPELTIHAVPPQDSKGNAAFYGDLMIIKAYLEGKHSLGNLEYGAGSEFLERYKEMDKEVQDKITDHLKRWKEVKNADIAE